MKVLKFGWDFQGSPDQNWSHWKVNSTKSLTNSDCLGSSGNWLTYLSAISTDETVECYVVSDYWSFLKSRVPSTNTSHRLSSVNIFLFNLSFVPSLDGLEGTKIVFFFSAFSFLNNFLRLRSIVARWSRTISNGSSSSCVLVSCRS